MEWRSTTSKQPQSARIQSPLLLKSLSTIKIIKRYTVLAAMDIGAKALGFTASVIVAKQLGVTAFGEINFAQAFVSYGLMATLCGLDVYAVRNVASLPANLGTVASTVMLLRLILAFGAYALLLILAAIVPQMQPVWWLIALFGLTQFTGALTLLWVPQAIQKTHVLGLANISIQGIYLCLVVIGIYMTRSTWSVPIALVAAELMVAIGLMIWMRRSVSRLERPMPMRQALHFLAQASPIGGAQILRAVALGSDLLLIGLLLSMSEVGLYGGSYKLYLLGISLMAMYFIVFFPHLVRNATVSKAALRHELYTSLYLLVPLAVICLGVGWQIVDQLLTLLYDSSFTAATTSLRILLLVLLVSFVNGHFRNALWALNRQKQDLGNVATSAMTHVVFKLALIPLFSIEGVAIGNLIGELVLLVLSWRSIKKVLGK